MLDHPAAEAGHARLHVSAGFAADPASAGRARALVSRACREWNVPHVASDAELVVTELVENAIRHARTSCDVDVELSDGQLRIAVRDGSVVAPRRRCPDPDRVGGRGLLLVERLSRDWGFDELDDGKRVWAVLPAAELASAASIEGIESPFTDRKRK
jgi:anti-sigma regulatory factor (Ser/Thr protein kinase)